MTCLHIFRGSNNTNQLAQHCNKTLLPGDAVLLIDQGSYFHVQQQFEQQLDVFICEAHAQARGQRFIPSAKKVQIDDIPTLFFNYDTVITWQ